MQLRLKRTPGLYLVGFMGSGKSTVGRALASELGWEFADLDEEIERREGASVSEIFETRGEPAFRKAEAGALNEQVRLVERGKARVIALGGGAYENPEHRELLRNNGVTIWLDCSFEMAERRVAGFSHRPLARDPVKLRALYEARRAGYSQADHTILIQSDDPAAAVAQILELGLI